METLPEYDPYIARFVRKVREAPDRADRYAELGLVYEANKFWSDARTCYQAALRLDAKPLLTRYHLAIVTQKLGDAVEAEALYRRITDRHPDFAPAFHRLGDLLAESGTVQQADAAFQRVMELRPDSAVGYTAAAALKLRARDFAAAAALAEQAIAIQPGARLPHFQLGRAYQGLDRPADANRELKQGEGAVKLFLPDAWTQSFPKYTVGVSAQVRLEKARAYLRAGDPQQAAQRLEIALEWYPDDPALLLELGATYLLLNEPDKACDRLERVRTSGSTEPRLYANLAMCRALLGRFEKALSAADRAVSLAPSSPLSHIARGRVMMRQGRFTDALEDLRRAVEADPTSATAQLELGNVNMLLNRFDESRRCYQATVELDPTSVEARLRLCDMCARLGDLAEARVQLEEARRMAPKHPQVDAMSRRLRSMTN